MSRLVPFAFIVLGAFPRVASAAKLQEQTVQAWNLYRDLTEKRIHAELDSGGKVLMRDFFPAGEAAGVRRKIQMGEIFTGEVETLNAERGKIKVPDGLIHHWYGSVFIPGAKIDDVLAWVQDYNRHKEYFEAVEDSRLVSRKGDVFEIHLKLQAQEGGDRVLQHRPRRHLPSDRSGPRGEQERGDAHRGARTCRHRARVREGNRRRPWFPLEAQFLLEVPPGARRCRRRVRGDQLEPRHSLARPVAGPALHKSVPREFLESTLSPMRDAFSQSAYGHTTSQRREMKSG